MASLRFRDLLRSKPEAFSIQGHILHGISWRTKTSVSGQRWGVCCIGTATRPSTRHWVFRFLEALQLAIDQSREHWGPNWSPDFLLPSWADPVPFSTPCSYHHALALFRFLCQCNWLSPALLTPEQASNLSTHSIKPTLLAAAGKLNLSLESRAKQGHHKKSVQFYSRDDVWPSLFLQRDILADISTGWRPLTSQARGAKQPLPETSFESAPVSSVDLQLVQMRQPKSSPATPSRPPTKIFSNPVEDSSESSDEECTTPITSSIMMINEKSHVVHAVRFTSNDCCRRSSFSCKDETFEILCGSSMVDATIQMIAEISPGAKICQRSQRKACLASIGHFLK